MLICKLLEICKYTGSLLFDCHASPGFPLAGVFTLRGVGVQKTSLLAWASCTFQACSGWLHTSEVHFQAVCTSSSGNTDTSM